MGPEAFWGQPGKCGFPSCAWTHLKKRPCATLVCLVGADNKYIKMSHKIRAIRNNTSLNVIKRNRTKLAGRIKKFEKDKQGKHI